MEKQVLIISKDRPEIDVLQQNLKKCGFMAIWHNEMSEVVGFLNKSASDCDICLVITDSTVLEHPLDNPNLLIHLGNFDQTVPFELMANSEPKREVQEIFQSLCRNRVSFAPDQTPLSTVIKRAVPNIIC